MKLYQLKITLALALFSLSPYSAALEFALFGDVTISDSNAQDENSQFALGQVDFFATTEIDDKTRVFVEYVFENDGDGLVVDLERLWIARQLNQGLTIAAGRFHTPLGQWNRTYHHGSFMQDSISRPFFLDFEDGASGVLPVHISGMMVWGSHYFSAGELSYEAFIANGSSINSDEFGFNASADGKPEIEINDSGDVNGSKSFGFRVTFAPTEQLSGSVFFMNNDVAESGFGLNSGVVNGEALVDQTISGIDFNSQHGAFDTLFEYYRFDNESNTVQSGGFTGNAFFAQLGWRYSEDFKALVRFETLDFEQQDSYFALLGARNADRQIVALRYELSSTNSLKLEISHEQPEATASLIGPLTSDSNTGVAVQWTFIVP